MFRHIAVTLLLGWIALAQSASPFLTVDAPYGIAADTRGNFYLDSQGPVDTSLPDPELWSRRALASYDSTGKLRWRVVYGTVGSGSRLAMDPQGNRIWLFHNEGIATADADTGRTQVLVRYSDIRYTGLDKVYDPGFSYLHNITAMWEQEVVPRALVRGDFAVWRKDREIYLFVSVTHNDALNPGVIRIKFDDSGGTPVFREARVLMLSSGQTAGALGAETLGIAVTPSGTVLASMVLLNPASRTRIHPDPIRKLIAFPWNFSPEQPSVTITDAPTGSGHDMAPDGTLYMAQAVGARDCSPYAYLQLSADLKTVACLTPPATRFAIEPRDIAIDPRNGYAYLLGHGTTLLSTPIFRIAVPGVRSTAKPDLLISSFTAPVRGDLGGKIEVNVTVRNAGSANAGPFRIGFFLSRNETVQTSDIDTGWGCGLKEGLERGGTSGCSGEIELPGELPAGTYRIAAIADTQNEVPEADESNNVGMSSAGPITVGSSASPVAAALTAPTPGATLTSTSVTFSWTPGNRVAQYYLRIGSTPDKADLYDRSQGQNRSVVVSGLPTDGRKLYIWLYSKYDTGEWWTNTYTCYSVTGGLPESTHPYEAMTDNTWTYVSSQSGTAQLSVAFHELTEVEDEYDFIYVMDSAGNNIPGSPFTGKSLAGKTVAVPGDTVKIRLLTDLNLEYWGFRVTSIRVN